MLLCRLKCGMLISLQSRWSTQMFNCHLLMLVQDAKSSLSTWRLSLASVLSQLLPLMMSKFNSIAAYLSSLCDICLCVESLNHVFCIVTACFLCVLTFFSGQQLTTGLSLELTIWFAFVYVLTKETLRMANLNCQKYCIPVSTWREYWSYPVADSLLFLFLRRSRLAGGDNMFSTRPSVRPFVCYHICEQWTRYFENEWTSSDAYVSVNNCMKRSTVGLRRSQINGHMRLYLYI